LAFLKNIGLLLTRTTPAAAFVLPDTPVSVTASADQQILQFPDSRLQFNQEK
jgi:hypothetical protein